MNNVRPFSYPRPPLVSNLLLHSHSPTITEAHKLPQGTILDLLMFPASPDALLLNHRLTLFDTCVSLWHNLNIPLEVSAKQL